MSLALANRRAAISPSWVKNPLWRTARAVPSLDQPFADTKSLVDAVTGQSLVTFTRASSGTSVGSDGLIKTAAVNEPRFDHNPTTGESLGLLVEEQRTNLLVRSEEFDSASWALNEATITANQIVAPNGSTTADLYTTSANTGVEHYVLQTFTAAASTTYTASVYIKAGTGSTCDLQYRVAGAWAGGNVLVNFNLSSEVATINSGTATASITPVGNGWFRCRITATSSVAGGSPQFRVATGDGGGTFYLWGAQLEVGAFPTSYIPTTTAAATRSADVASITGTAFSSWYRQDEGTVFAEYLIPSLLDGTVTSFEDGTANNRWQMRYMTSPDRGRLRFVSSSGSLDLTSTAAKPNANQTSKSAYTAKTGDQAWVTNAIISAATGTLATMPVADRLLIGTGTGSDQAKQLTIRRLTYWPQRLPNSTLQAITQ